MKEHYTDGRRWSYISNAWIFESGWNDKEEIARLQHEIQQLRAPPAARDSGEVINHEEALAFAYLKRNESNLARCYIALRETPATDGLSNDQGEVKFKVDDQWYYRGNRSPTWLYVASRPDGSCQDGICEKVPGDIWPLLNEIARLAAAPQSGKKEDVQALYDELLYAVQRKWPGESRHQTALRYIQNAEKPAPSPPASKAEGE